MYSCAIIDEMVRVGSMDERATRKIAAVERSMVSYQTITRLAATFKVLGDPTRTRIVIALSKAELRVGELVPIVGLSMSAISHQLRLLRNFELVRVRKEGKMAFYSLDDEHIDNLMAEALRHVTA